MIISGNKIIKNHVDYNNINDIDVELPNTLHEILDLGFVHIDKCVYFKHNAPHGPYSKDLHDRTGNECFYNNIHIDNYSDQADILNIGIRFALELYEKLTNESIGSFKVILSFNSGSCSVCFHKNRIGELYLDKNLDNYTLEGILVFENSPTEM